MNVGSPEPDVTLPYSPQPESGLESFAERIAAADAVLDGAQHARNIQNDIRRSAKPLAASETVFRPHYVAPMSWQVQLLFHSFLVILF